MEYKRSNRVRLDFFFTHTQSVGTFVILVKIEKGPSKSSEVIVRSTWVLEVYFLEVGLHCSFGIFSGILAGELGDIERARRAIHWNALE